MAQPLLLCLETATEVCSVCLSCGDEVLALVESFDRNDHAALITTYIAQCMEQAGKTLSEIDAVAVSGGPGSYTSLRIGLSTAKGICYALEKPLIAVDTLAALARKTRSDFPNTSPTLFAPMIDARRMEVYMGLFDQHLQAIEDPEAVVLHPGLFEAWPQHLVVACGNGAPKALDVFAGKSFEVAPVVCSAPHLIAPALAAFARADFADLAYYEPFYLKPPNITIPRKNVGIGNGNLNG